MAFIDLNFSPVGGNARAGNAPQVFSYASVDTLGAVEAPGYFNDASPYVRRGDWLDIFSRVNVNLKHTLQFILGDGSTPSAATAAVDSGGTGYADDDLVEVTYVDGTVLNKTILIVSATGGVVDGLEFLDPGLFSDIPTTLSGLATAILTGSGNNDLTVDMTLLVNGPGIVTVSDQFIDTT